MGRLMKLKMKGGSERKKRKKLRKMRLKRTEE